MKNKLLVMILIGMICNAQYYPIRISFNNGEVLQGIGKFKNSATIKYKAHKDAESEEFEVAKIKQVEIMLDRKNISLYRIYQTIENSGFISVVEVVKGGKVQLYKPYWADTGQGNMSMGMAKMTMNATNAGMGMPMGMGMGGFGGGVPLTYYVKKPNDEKLTTIGYYDILADDFEKNINNYFSDCPDLIEKIAKKQFKVRKQLAEIVTYYNENCK